MVITLYTQELLNDIREKSHLEVAEILDAEARYRAEAGTEKTGEVFRCIEEAIREAEIRCMLYLREQFAQAADNSLDYPDTFNFVFSMSERRSIGKTKPMRTVLHNFVVHYALSRFYQTVSQGALAEKHALVASAEGTAIEDLLYSKLPPRV
ncbi:MAG: hypothetical protein J6Y27_05210 [Bacteroidales bacterium]|nr:hypothetical protein [Bacteroidales bacterium]